MARTMRQQLSMQVIKSARGMLANTPVQKWPVTTLIYRKVFRFGYTADELTTDFRGIKLTIPTKDTTIVPGLVGGFYEKIELDVFELLAEQSRVILDVGGSIGDYTCVGANRLPADGHIVAFEPIPENQAYIKKNLEQNQLTSKATVAPVAVGDRDAEIDIYMVEGSVGTHSAAATSAAGVSTKSVHVPVVMLDSYVVENKLANIDILKIDVEGYDGFVLKGAQQLIRKFKPTMFIEFVADNLKNCGFDPNEFLVLLKGGYKHIYMVDEPRGILKRCNDQDLARLTTHSMNANLILSDRAAHITTINTFLTKSKA